MKEDKQSLKELALKAKDNFTIKQMLMVAIVFFCTMANVLMDYLAPGFNFIIFLNPAYWIALAVQQVAVIMIMLCVYSFMIDKETQSNEDIAAFRKTLSVAHCKLSEYGLTQKFDDYVYVKNYERKKRAYRIKMERKIFKAKTDERRKALEEERDKGLASIKFIKVKYEKIIIAEIFSRASLINPEDESMSEHRNKATAKMLCNKILSVVMFGLLLGSIGFEPVKVGWNMLIKTFIKLFQAAYAVYVGGSEGIGFARGNLLSALGNRAKFVQLFIDDNKPDSAAVNKLREDEQRLKQAEAEKILRERDEEVAEVHATNMANE